MTVGELIGILSKLKSDKDILIYDDNDTLDIICIDEHENAYVISSTYSHYVGAGELVNNVYNED